MAVKICLTGGPCGGKSTCLAAIEQALSARNYKVLIIPETATELILNGIRPGDFECSYDFQKLVFEKQFSKELLYDEAAKNYENVVILCDRGYLDQMAYISKSEFLELAKNYGFDEAGVYSNYDAVIHLVTAANGTTHYNLGNVARTETPEQAIEADNKTMAAWVGHTHLRVIDNSTGFDEKVNRVIKEVFDILGEPTPSEIERKFLIEKPDVSDIPMCSKADIIQTYLVSTNGTERRVRQRGTKESGFNFYYTEKTEVAFGERAEVEKRISMKEYIDYLTEADTSLNPIHKTRYCFLYKNQYFEMDFYPFSEDKAIVEIELNNINQAIEMPPFINVIKEVTDDNLYKNYSLAKSQKL